MSELPIMNIKVKSAKFLTFTFLSLFFRMHMGDGFISQLRVTHCLEIVIVLFYGLLAFVMFFAVYN